MDKKMGTFNVEDDQLLIRRARKGDEKAIESIYHTFKSPVFRLARRVCGEADGAEEVVQETFLEVVKSIRKYRGEAPLGSWIKKIAASKSLMRLRKEKGHRRDVPLEEGKVSDLSGRSEVGTAIDLEKLLNELSSSSRAVLWLHDVEGYSHPEIGQMMQKSESFSKSRLSRAYAELRKICPAVEEGDSHAS